MVDLGVNLQVQFDDLEIPGTGGPGIDDAVILGLTGAVGGAGVTTTAIQMAYHLAGTSSVITEMSDVCLLSLDFENGALREYLDLRPSATFEDFNSIADTPDIEKTAGLMTNTQFGFHTLVLPTVLDGNRRADPEKILAVLDHACSLYRYIILDIPRLWTPWTHAAFGAADRVGMLTHLSVPALRTAREKAKILIDAVDGLEDIDFIVNKFERRSFKNSIKISDAEKALNRNLLQTISYSPDKVREAGNRGEPVEHSYKESRFVRDVNAFTDLWQSEIMSLRAKHAGETSTFY